MTLCPEIHHQSRPLRIAIKINRLEEGKLRLRPYKSRDAITIESWIRDKEVFRKWGGERFGEFPIHASVIDEKYTKHNGDCPEEDNFYPWVAVDEEDRVVGHLIMRYTNGDHRQWRFGWVIVDDAMRGKGYGKQMLSLGLTYAFDFLGADKVTIGVFENNESAHRCYKNAGFADVETVSGEPWNVIEMEVTRCRYQEEKECS